MGNLWKFSMLYESGLYINTFYFFWLVKIEICFVNPEVGFSMLYEFSLGEWAEMTQVKLPTLQEMYQMAFFKLFERLPREC